MDSKQAKSIGGEIKELVASGRVSEASETLTQILLQRVSFRLLDIIGEKIGSGELDSTNLLLEKIAATGSMGGWVIIASAMRQQLERDFSGVFQRCRGFVITADTWYATDIFGERAPGPSLVTTFEPTLEQLAPWRIHTNPWVRRTTGIAVHFWAKRTKGRAEAIPMAKLLLDFLQPMFTERDMNAIKGVGWGLKTLGRYYPDAVAGWLSPQIKKGGYRELMLRQAVKFLPPELRGQLHPYHSIPAK